MNGRKYRRKRSGSSGFIPPAMMVLIFFVAVFAILLMGVAVARGIQDRRARKEKQTAEPAVVETVQTTEEINAATE